MNDALDGTELCLNGESLVTLISGPSTVKVKVNFLRQHSIVLNIRRLEWGVTGFNGFGIYRRCMFSG